MPVKLQLFMDRLRVLVKPSIFEEACYVCFDSAASNADIISRSYVSPESRLYSGSGVFTRRFVQGTSSRLCSITSHPVASSIHRILNLLI